MLFILEYVLFGIACIILLFLMPAFGLFGGFMVAMPFGCMTEVLQGLWEKLIKVSEDISHEIKQPEMNTLNIIKQIALGFIVILGILVSLPICLALLLLSIAVGCFPLITAIAIIWTTEFPGWLNIIFTVVASVIYIAMSIVILTGKDYKQQYNVQ